MNFYTFNKEPFLDVCISGEKLVWKKCCVPECNSPPDISYYAWPKERKQSIVWSSLVFKSVAMPKTKQILRVCGLHFARDDFANGLKAELMGFKGRLVLKPTAVPSLLAKSGSESGIKEQQKKIVDKAMGIAPKYCSVETQTDLTSEDMITLLKRAETIDNSNKKRKFTEDELTTGLVLKSMSTKAFNFIKSNNLLKLPSVSTQGISI